MHWHWHCIEFCIVIVLAFSFGRGVHTVGHASPPLDAASWRRSSAFSSARRLSSAVGSSAPSGSGSSAASSTLSSSGARGGGDARADFEPAILPFQGMRRERVAPHHFHARCSSNSRCQGFLQNLRVFWRTKRSRPVVARGKIRRRAFPTAARHPVSGFTGKGKFGAS